MNGPAAGAEVDGLGWLLGSENAGLAFVGATLLVVVDETVKGLFPGAVLLALPPKILLAEVPLLMLFPNGLLVAAFIPNGDHPPLAEALLAPGTAVP